MGEEALEQPKLVNFSELGLGFGQELELLPNPGDSSSRFICELVGCLGSESLMIGPPASGELPSLMEGQRVVVRLRSAGGVAVFPSTVLYVSNVPTMMVYLDYPRNIKFKQMRSALRVDVALPVLVVNQTARSSDARPGKIVDISVSGARLAMFEALGSVGDDIELRGKFRVGAIQRVLAIEAVIRTKTVLSNQRFYGIEFHEGDEDKLLVLMGFIFHAMAFGHLQAIR